MKEKMEYFCTLFDHNYLHRGLALYESLKTTMKEDFHMYILCMSDICLQKIKSFQLTHATPISLSELENEKLLFAKSNRTLEEYCWTCTPAIIKYVLENYEVERCTYLDSDIYFFSSPSELLSGMENSSVMITKHGYTKELEYASEKNGIYNVQFIPFCNDKLGKEVLEWWYERCLEWCYRKYEDGKMGDQMYLDSWMTKFSGVCEMHHIGGGIAPWNAARFSIFRKNSKNYVKEMETLKTQPVIFYHFHTFKMFDKDVVKLASGLYKIPGTIVSILYKEYIATLMKAIEDYKIAKDFLVWGTYEKFQSENIDYLNKENNYYNLSLFYSDRADLR